MKHQSVAAGTLLALIPACTTTTQQDGVFDEDYQKHYVARMQQMKETDARLNQLPRVMIDLDKAIDKYFEAVHKGADHRVLATREALDTLIRGKTRRHFDALVRTAENPEHVGNRGIALAALGFADEPRSQLEKAGNQPGRNYVEIALNSLITALGDENDHVVNQALHGLGMLRAQHTPTKAIGAILETSKNDLGMRRVAAWTLMSIQPQLAGDHKNSILPIWMRLLSQPIGELEPEIVVQAVRGLGLYRRSEDARIIEPYCEHPVALVRAAAAIALGRQMNQGSHKKLFELLEPSETNRNVRRMARGALTALAGGRDRGYDLKKWEKQFQRK